jgi:hypothetical protein
MSICRACNYLLIIEVAVYQGLLPRKVTVMMVSPDSFNGKWDETNGLWCCALNLLPQTQPKLQL